MPIMRVYAEAILKRADINLDPTVMEGIAAVQPELTNLSSFLQQGDLLNSINFLIQKLDTATQQGRDSDAYALIIQAANSSLNRINQALTYANDNPDAMAALSSAANAVGNLINAAKAAINLPNQDQQQGQPAEAPNYWGEFTGSRK